MCFFNRALSETPLVNTGKTDPKKYIINHTNFKIKDPKVTFDFYFNVLGMELLGQHDFPDIKSTLYMVGYKDQDAGAKSMFARGSMIEFEYIYGTDTDPNFKGYETGNQNQDGFGHFAII
ncbi:hypothetical protein BB560_006152, partial [Smittium megazygosporum]